MSSFLGLLALLLAIPATRHAYGMSQMWPRYRHGPGHIDVRRPIAARWAMVSVALVVVAVWLFVVGLPIGGVR